MRRPSGHRRAAERATRREKATNAETRAWLARVRRVPRLGPLWPLARALLVSALTMISGQEPGPSRAGREQAAGPPAGS